ncbi:MAG: prenyltransferase, partial [Thermoplasmataceae archaeon]
MNISKSLKLPLYFTSVSPVIVMWSYSGFREYWLFLLLIAVVVFMQAALNLSMDYFDHLNGRNLRNEDTMFPIGSYLIEHEKASPGKVRVAFIISAVVSVSFGIAIIALTGKYDLLVIGILALIVSFMYVLPPFRFNSRGF